MKFRKKPVVIEAMQWTGTNMPELIEFIGEHPPTDVLGFFIHTLEGQMFASPGDWIIKGVAGEFYPCKPDIFAATYERVGGLSRLVETPVPVVKLDPGYLEVREARRER
jgi:hypothetical protein